jgi:hypothetical protein
LIDGGKAEGSKRSAGELVREVRDPTVMRDPEGNQFCIAER